MIYCPAELRVYALETTLPDFSVFMWGRLAHHQNAAPEPTNGTVQQYMDILKLVQHGLLVEPMEPCPHPRWLYASETGRELHATHIRAMQAQMDWRWDTDSGDSCGDINNAVCIALNLFFARIAPTYCASCGDALGFTEIHEAMQHRNLCEDCNGKHGRCECCKQPFVSKGAQARAHVWYQGNCPECWTEMEEIPSDPHGKSVFYGVSRRS